MDFSPRTINFTGTLDMRMAAAKQGGQAVGPYRIRNEQRHDIYQVPNGLSSGSIR